MTDNQLTSPIVFRNSRFLIGLMILGSLVAALFAIGFLLIPIGQWAQQPRFSISMLASAISWLVGAISIGFLCPWLWSLARKMRHYRVLITAEAAGFLLGSGKSPQVHTLTWSQIRAIQHKRIGNAQYYVVVADAPVQFSSYTFFRPKKLARVLAQRIDKPIQEV